MITQPPLPTPAQLADARQVVLYPARFASEPDFQSLCATAWFALKADQLARIEASRTAAAIRAAMPDDAA